MLRQDPDVILIGEMRDEETVGTALSAAETGHLVLSTLHTIDAVETINRIVDFFPPHHHQQVRAMLAGSLRGVISQRLVPTSTARAASAACEILTMTGRVRDMIFDANETGKLGEAIADGAYYGMQTFDQALLQALPGRQDQHGRGAQGGHAPARLQAAGRVRGPALELGRPDLLPGHMTASASPPASSAARGGARAEPATAGNGNRAPSAPRPGRPARPRHPQPPQKPYFSL